MKTIFWSINVLYIENSINEVLNVNIGQLYTYLPTLADMFTCLKIHRL